MSSSPPSSPNGPGAVAAVPPTTSDQSRSINQMLHLAQGHTFANLNSGREATDMAFIEGLIQSRQLAAEETRQNHAGLAGPRAAPSVADAEGESR